MLTGIESSLGGSLSNGSLAALQDKSRERQMAEKAKAASQGGAVADKKDIDAKLRGVAEEFVSVFMNQVMKAMRSTVQQNPEMHGDNGEKFFQEMLDTEQSKLLAKGSGYGLTDLIYQALLRKQSAGGTGTAAKVEETPDAATVEM